jgi:hypothetical protein
MGSQPLPNIAQLNSRTDCAAYFLTTLTSPFLSTQENLT